MRVVSAGVPLLGRPRLCSGFVFDATPAMGVGLRPRRCGGGCPPVTEGPLEASDTVRLATFIRPKLVDTPFFGARERAVGFMEVFRHEELTPRRRSS